MIETQETISKWGNETFGPKASDVRLAIRLNQEMAELLMKISNIETKHEVAEELADVYIILMQLASLIGIDLQSNVNYKMVINRARQWKHDGTGCAQHI